MWQIFKHLNCLTGGEGGIRTHDTLARIPVFETGTFNRSVTSPGARILPSASARPAAGYGVIAFNPRMYDWSAGGMSTPPSARW